MSRRQQQPARDRGLDELGQPLRRPLRQSVGPPEWWDLVAGLQFSLLFAEGMREHHRLLDIGCGSLRGGRLFIPYLADGNYYGMEPFQHLVDEGIEHEVGRDQVELKHPHFEFRDDFGFDAFGVDFDFMVAQSILSHTCADLTRKLLKNASGVMAPGGVLCATFFRRRPFVGMHTQRQRGFAGSGWVEARGVAYTWREMEQLAAEAGLAARVLQFPHPRQTWFVAVRKDEHSRLSALARAARGWGDMRRRVHHADALRHRNPRAAKVTARVRSLTKSVRARF